LHAARTEKTCKWPPIAWNCADCDDLGERTAPVDISEDPRSRLRCEGQIGVRPVQSSANNEESVHDDPRIDLPRWDRQRCAPCFARIRYSEGSCFSISM